MSDSRPIYNGNMPINYQSYGGYHHSYHPHPHPHPYPYHHPHPYPYHHPHPYHYHHGYVHGGYGHREE
ncbi:hypothetical protein [Heyndrickxia ginsengihumi]|uniref:hypothetical protein n=1 Tax=Heyndrickxia ginsengihumi TaxID=363870 RepID=UPI0004B31449|nr:hypothetical protein [Heyndrickxia ginsengihumi]MCM3025128.1 hypothetical protein [Heyndrickxia ginsengihumi]